MKHDRHNYAVVATVFLCLGVYFYLFTHVHQSLSIAAPEDLATTLGFESDAIFDSDRNVDSNLWATSTQIFDNDDERFIIFAMILAAFLCVYFSSLKTKLSFLSLWFFVGFLFLYGPRTTAALLLGHLIVYLTFHEKNKHSPTLSILVGLLGFYAFFPFENFFEISNVLAAVYFGLASYGFYRKGWERLLQYPRAASFLRIVVIQGPFAFSLGAAVIEGFNGYEWSIPIGLLLFFLQWERLMIYHIDYKNGQVPKDLPLSHYLALFLSPAVFPNWTSNPYIGQGYTYMMSRFLNKDKNKIVLGGLKLWGLALMYFIIGDSLVQFIITFFRDQFDIIVYPYISRLVRFYVHGTPMSTPTVLLSCLLDQVRFFVLMASIVHFKVGAWRLFGFDVDPQYNRPWAGTNLSNFWTRYAFHFREFLSRAFFYPVFLKYFKKNLKLRLFVATMAAAAVGNLFWGHMPDRLWTRGLNWEGVVNRLESWPYFVLLGVSIYLTDLYLMKRKRRRKPWTWDRWLWTDVLAAYFTIQYFALIHVFARPHPDGTLWDYTRLFLIGLGIEV